MLTVNIFSCLSKISLSKQGHQSRNWIRGMHVLEIILESQRVKALRKLMSSSKRDV